MDEVEQKNVSLRDETSSTPATAPKIKMIGVDTRSREAFELLKLGEAICSLQADQRRMRLDADDMRFERDRYKASAAAFQDKLAEALNENARLRDLREVLQTFSHQQAESEGRIAELLRDNDRLARDLQEFKVHSERMRYAFIKITCELIAEVGSTVIDDVY